MQNPLCTATLLALHKDCILLWKTQGLIFNHQGIYGQIEENHAFNCQLWDAEDKARLADPTIVFDAKRKIDAYNQQRNNRMEAIDNALFQALDPAPITHCPVHSETPGMMIDRLSILALKSYHMDLQVKRGDVDKAHKQTCQNKLHIIQQQLLQLADCLDLFLDEIIEKKRTFRVYHQFKMYNDPKLNPQLYLVE